MVLNIYIYIINIYILLIDFNNIKSSCCQRISRNNFFFVLSCSDKKTNGIL